MHSLAPAPIPADAGIGLRFPHHRHVVESRPATGWFEVHAENYMAGGAPLTYLETVRRDYPVSLHAVGLSLGGTDPLDMDHLARLKALAERIEPGLISDHLSWSAIDGVYLADLLPLPYTEEALAVAADNIDRVQSALGRTILVENPSTYLAFAASVIGESEFLAELARRTGCGILCDVNNIYVSACNLGADPFAWFPAMAGAPIGEIHLAGHAVRQLDDGQEIRIDDHGSAVDPAVWALYAHALGLFGPVPTLIEWDTAIPEFSVLEGEAAQAQRMLDRHSGTEAGNARAA
ncbi:MAG TPA: DUF692 domain-containing protein [Alphaproteobacteria bacterium]|nr:DUF692 domain-containing protein [Alphaproteobacteria bacterium]